MGDGERGGLILPVDRILEARLWIYISASPKSPRPPFSASPMSSPTFATVFGCSPQAIAQAPGRVNLLGEHTDYNQGFVLPTILPQCTTVAVAIDLDRVNSLDAFSTRYPDERRSPRDFSEDLTEIKNHHWTDYLLACMQQLQHRKITLPSLKVWVDSDVPTGAGVSSSAALEIAFLKALRTLLALNLSDLELVLIAQRAESEGVGMPCGVMDQMVSLLGRSHHALFLDTQDLAIAHIPLPTTHHFAVVHSGKVHHLANSEYKQRRQDCEQAADLLGVKSLRELDVDCLKTSIFGNLTERLQQRVRHVLTENQRVLLGGEALRENQIEVFGELMNASHESQKIDFDVTVPETDYLCEIARNYGAIGARQTGGGFGGAIVALLPHQLAPTWWASVAKHCPQASLICGRIGGRGDEETRG